MKEQRTSGWVVVFLMFIILLAVVGTIFAFNKSKSFVVGTTDQLPSTIYVPVNDSILANISCARIYFAIESEYCITPDGYPGDGNDYCYEPDGLKRVLFEKCIV